MSWWGDTRMWSHFTKSSQIRIMSLQYIADSSGHPTAVIIPINDWNGIRDKYPDVENIEGELPQWQKDLIDARLKEIADDPSCLHPIEDLFNDLDNDDD